MNVEVRVATAGEPAIRMEVSGTDVIAEWDDPRASEGRRDVLAHELANLRVEQILQQLPSSALVGAS